MPTINVRGPQEAMEHIRAMAEAYPAIAEKALARTLLSILAESAEECPVRHGFLRGSRYMTDPVAMYGHVMSSLGYSMDYAIFVHENMRAFHPVGKAKFLEDPIMRHVGDIPQTLCEEIDALAEAVR